MYGRDDAIFRHHSAYLRWERLCAALGRGQYLFVSSQPDSELLGCWQIIWCCCILTMRPRQRPGHWNESTVQYKQPCDKLPCWSTGEDSVFPTQGAWVRFWGGELRSCRRWSMVKIKTDLKKLKENNLMSSVCWGTQAMCCGSVVRGQLQGVSWPKESCCSVAQLFLILCNPMNCSMPDFPVLHHLPEFVQTLVHWVGDAIQPSHPLLPPSPPPVLNLFQYQCLFQWISSFH